MRWTPLALIALLSVTLSGCGGEPAAPPAESVAGQPTPAASKSADHAPNGEATGPEISAEDFIGHVRRLSSDEFGGRAPGTEGETLTTNYLRDQFKRLGLAPGNGDSYFQTVPMVQTTADEWDLEEEQNHKECEPRTERDVFSAFTAERQSLARKVRRHERREEQEQRVHHPEDDRDRNADDRERNHEHGNRRRD